MNWTSEYPTKPGYYWVRNLLRAVDPKWQPYQETEPEPFIVDVTEELTFYPSGSETERDKSDIISAEWYGPIQPPLEESACLVGGHPPDCRGHIQGEEK